MEEARMKVGKIARQGLFAAATTFALGFGAMEALAAPGAAAAPAACTAIWAAKCNDICQGKGYDYGICDGATGACVCGFYPAE
jgi:hypothetical protein